MDVAGAETGACTDIIASLSYYTPSGSGWGGLGIESLSSRVVRRKAAMVMLWRSDAGGVMRSTYKAMRAAHDGALDSLVGPELGEVRAAIGEEPRVRATCEGLFYTGMHYALAANGLTWQDGGELKGWRMDDHHAR